MALQNLRPSISSLLEDDGFAQVRTFLNERGLDPHNESAILAAIRERGWELEITGMTGDWSVEIKEYRAPTQSQSAVAHDSDRQRALFRALRLALSWLTPQQERDAFDRETRARLGIGAEEFIQRWNADEFSMDDPHVRYLVMLRPLGW
jgi:hypothetical protein